MSKELDKLIEQVLTEKIMLVDPYPKKKADKFKDTFGDKDFKFQSKKLDKLAAADRDKTDLSDADVEAAYYDYIKSGGTKSHDEWEAARKIIDYSTVDAVRQGAQAAATTASKRLKIDRASSIPATTTAQAIGDKDAEYRSSVLNPMGTPAAIYRDMAYSGKFTDIQGTPLRTITGINMDSSIVESVRAVPGGTLLQKLMGLVSINKKLEDQPNALTNQEVAEVANGIRFLNLLGACVQEFEDSSAGTAFETFLALLSGGIIVGGESGAIDIVGSDGTFMSAKLYSSTDIKQSYQEGNQIGIAGVVDQNWNEIVYVVGMKVSASDSTSYKDFQTRSDGINVRSKYLSADPGKIKFVDFIMIKIRRDDALGTYKAWAMGKWKDSGRWTEVDSDKHLPVESAGNLTLGQTVAWAYGNSKVGARIPILERTGETSKNATQRLNNAINDWANDLLSNISMIFKKLKNIDLNTQEYIAQEASGQDNIDHVDHIVGDYTTVGDNLKFVIDEFEGKGTAKKKGLEENKSSLDQLIEAVIKGMLK